MNHIFKKGTKVLFCLIASLEYAILIAALFSPKMSFGFEKYVQTNGEKIAICILQGVLAILACIGIFIDSAKKSKSISRIKKLLFIVIAVLISAFMACCSMATINGEISILKSFNKVTAREILIVVSFIVTMFYMLPCKCYAALRCLGRMIRVYCK